ncbi:phage minor head protein [Streptomyces griseus]|uniref:phage minor head protein n=1 Tax=Streptomyces griseus TaxID=1911 RepID=UPI003666C2D0
MGKRDDQLDQEEAAFAELVAQALTDTADEFAASVAGATELVAARFSVSRIARMWGNRTRSLVRRLLGTAEEAAVAAAEDTGTTLPDGWDDLPGRYDDGTLPEGIGQYVTTTEHLLRAVGDRLSEAARRELAAGLDAGEDIDQLRDRLRAAFARDGAQLGPAREQRVAQTEASRAWNTATLAAARAVTGPDRPVVKQWVTRHDARVRASHKAVDGQIRLLAEPFSVAGVPMQTPGDPTAPAAQVCNCRCRLAVAPEMQAAAFKAKDAVRIDVLESEEKRVNDAHTVSVTASGGHTGAMIALVPAVQDAERLALTAPGAEPADELHLTLFYLGEAADWDEEQQADLVARLQSRAPDLGEVVAGRAFGANQWNANGEDPCWVWSVSDDPDRPQHAPTLETARWAATYALEELHRAPTIPTQHSPWQPHVCAAYSSSPSLLNAMNQRLGPVTFDRLRIAFAGQYTDIPLGPAPEEAPVTNDVEPLSAMKPRPWHNPDDTALVYENQETGDGRVFRPGGLYWGAGPWPLQYADEMLGAHQGAELAGAILTLDRDGDRIPGTGVLYPNRPAGADALTLLEEQAPLGVSVDLDDVSVEFVNRVVTEDGGEEDGVVILAAALLHASVLRLSDGSYSLTASSTSEWISAGASLARTGAHGTILTGPGGRVEATAVTRAFSHLGLRDTGARVTAAAGDPNDEESGVVVHRESSGDLLMRVTRARVRGATLVAMPAYDTARIVLVDDPSPELAASGNEADEDLAAGGGPSAAHLQVVAFVKSSASPVGARMVARALGMKMETARGHLARAAKAGRIVRLAPGLYVGPKNKSDEELEASASGQLDLPVDEDRDRPWDGDEAKARLLEAATVDGTVDPDRLAAGFLWRDDDADPATAGAYRLPFADVIGGELRVVAAGVYAVAAALQGARGGVDIPEADADAVKERVESLYGRLADTFDDPSIIPPWMDDDGDRDRDRDDEDDDGEETAAMKELVASAWAAMQDLPPMPAAWFREPTAEELPPDSGGVHYANGRVYGWVAQRGVPHAAYPGRNLTIEKLAREGLDFSHFLRARFQLDDGSTVKVGAMTMNVGHDGDGAQCDDAVCQFDNSGTVGAIVTVGMSRGGLWFSGAGAPWLSAWDQTVFRACQPSYHLRGKRGGGWELRAVLDVPVPGHSSPLVAAVIQRSNLALAASAAVVEDMEARLRTLSERVSDSVPDTSGQDTDTVPVTAPDLPGHRPDTSSTPVRTAFGQTFRSADADAIAVALVSSERFIDGLLTAMERRQKQRDTHARQEAERLAASVIAPARAGLPTGKTTPVMEGAV